MPSASPPPELNAWLQIRGTWIECDCGWRTIRITWQQLQYEAQMLAADLRALLTASSL
jgi:hypothetical protein